MLFLQFYFFYHHHACPVFQNFPNSPQSLPHFPLKTLLKAFRDFAQCFSLTQFNLTFLCYLGVIHSISRQFYWYQSIICSQLGFCHFLASAHFGNVLANSLCARRYSCVRWIKCSQTILRYVKKSSVFCQHDMT